MFGLLLAVLLWSGLSPIASADAPDPLLAVVSVSGASMQEEFHHPDGWWQRISVSCDLTMRLYGHFVTVEDGKEVYELTRKEGDLRFRGTAEDHFFGATEVWHFDDQRHFDLRVSGGVLRFDTDAKRVVYVGFPLQSSTQNNMRPYHLRVLNDADPTMVRLFVDLPSMWWFDDAYDFDGQVTPVVPTFELVEAKMITPNELGVGVTVTYPVENQDQARLVLLEANINGVNVRKELDLTAHTNPGQSWGRVSQQNQMYGINGNLLPTTPLRIDLSAFGVPRFEDEIEFQLRALAYTGPGLSSSGGDVQVLIHLPVVQLHGYMHPWGFPPPLLSIHPPFLGGLFVAYEGAYKAMKERMLKEGYDNEDQWENPSLPKYRTYWDPKDFNYSDPQKSTPDMIRSDIVGLVQKVRTQTYARKVNFVGHSFGGLVARDYAASYPEDVNKVITVGTPHLGATFFYQIAFSFSTKSEADAMTLVPSEPSAGQPNALLWTVPTYHSIDPSSVAPPYPNTLTQAKGPGVRYYALYGNDHDTDEILEVKSRGSVSPPWWEVMRKQKAPGDGFILESSAKAFADASYRVPGVGHARFLNSQIAQGEILKILSNRSSGGGSGNNSIYSFIRGRLLPSETESWSMQVPSGSDHAFLGLDWPGSTMELRVVDPTGRVIDSAWPTGTDGIQISVEPNGIRYLIPDPPPGEWTFEVIAVDVAPSGEEFEATAHFVFVPALDGPLTIDRIGSELAVLSWPAKPGSVLQTAPTLVPPVSWTDVPSVPIAVNFQNTLTIPTVERQRFYRVVTVSP